MMFAWVGVILEVILAWARVQSAGTACDVSVGQVNVRSTMELCYRPGIYCGYMLENDELFGIPETYFSIARAEKNSKRL
jgi:hypothetical protein